jgi:DNA-binding MarR family transcriptional regulator
MHSLSVDQRSDVLRQTADALVRRDGPELTTHQLGVFITCYLMDDVLTVRDLCLKLNASKPAITRALDRLFELDLVCRKTDQLDRRRILIHRTTAGARLLLNIEPVLADTTKVAREQSSPPVSG